MQSQPGRGQPSRFVSLRMWLHVKVVAEGPPDEEISCHQVLPPIG